MATTTKLRGPIAIALNAPRCSERGCLNNATDTVYDHNRMKVGVFCPRHTNMKLDWLKARQPESQP